MKTLLLIPLLALALTGTAQARPNVACNLPQMAASAYLPGKIALQGLASGIAHRTTPAPQGSFCGGATINTAGAALVAATGRFNTLLAQFPKHPTKAQWGARWTPLVLAAIAQDNAAAKFAVALGNWQRMNNGITGTQANMVAAIRTDAAWLHAHLHAAYGAPLAP